MGEHIEEIAFLTAQLTLIAARIEALKLKQQSEALKNNIKELTQELHKLRNNEVKS